MRDDEIINQLNAACRTAGSQAAWAADHGLTQPYVSQVLRGSAKPGPKILTALGIEIGIVKRPPFSGGRAKTSDPVGKRASYKSWNQMIQRCRNPRNPRYDDYGGRGITVCHAWLKYPNFRKDMGEPPPGFQIERRDNNLGYDKANCLWVDRKTQMRNRRNSALVEMNGMIMTMAEAMELLKLSRVQVIKRMNRIREHEASEAAFPSEAVVEEEFSMEGFMKDMADE